MLPVNLGRPDAHLEAELTGNLAGAVRMASGETLVVAGAGFGADSNRMPVTTVLWTYEGVRQGERQMQRAGLAASHPHSSQVGQVASPAGAASLGQEVGVLRGKPGGELAS